jgi:hypothetical protein
VNSKRRNPSKIHSGISNKALAKPSGSEQIKNQNKALEALIRSTVSNKALQAPAGTCAKAQ